MLGFVFNRILNRWRRKPSSRPEDIPKKLNAVTLEKAMQEARFLHSHQVNIQPLATGEIPVPRRADKN